MSSSGKVLVPIILIVSVLCTIGVIYGGLEMSDSQRSAFDVLKDLISGELTLKDIWDALTGKDGGDSCTGPDVNGVYALDSAGYCVKKGCKPGYFEQGGICLKQQDLSSNVYTGEESVDCQLDPDNPYFYGQCKHPSSGKVLTPYAGNCGIGIKTKTPNPKYIQIGLGGTCAEETLEECSVACPEVCTAPPSLWAPIDGAQCKAIVDGESVVLGEVDTETGFGYCGEGGIVNTFSQDNITGNDQGVMNLEEYKNSINFSLCEEEKGGNCNVACTDNLIDIGCPSREGSWDWIVAMEGAIYKRESAQKVLNRQIAIGDAELMPGVTRQDAADLGVLNEAQTKVLDLTKMPKGVQIWFKAGETNSYQNLTANKCSIVELQDAEAPRISTPCEITDVDGDCASVGCGQNYVKWRVPTVTKMAWGNGTCNPGSNVPINCEQQEASCCDVKYVREWEEETGYDGCVQDIDGQYRRQSTREGNGTLCSESNTRLGELCSYDCKLESLEMEYKGTITSSTSPSCAGKYNKKDLTSISLRAAKGGTACPEISTLLNVPFQSSDQVNAILEGADFSDVSVPDFKCGAWIRGGGCGIPNMDWDNGICLNGNNCGDGDKFSGLVGWKHRPSFQKNC
jgi:hypothetical protein